MKKLAIAFVLSALAAATASYYGESSPNADAVRAPTPKILIEEARMTPDPTLTGCGHCNQHCGCYLNICMCGG